MGQLNELQIKAAQPRDKEYMLSDGEAAQHVFQYAVDVGALEPAKNFVNSRTGGLRAPRARHYAAINDPLKLGQLLRDIRAYNGNVITRATCNSRRCCSSVPGSSA